MRAIFEDEIVEIWRFDDLMQAKNVLMNKVFMNLYFSL